RFEPFRKAHELLTCADIDCAGCKEPCSLGLLPQQFPRFYHVSSRACADSPNSTDGTRLPCSGRFVIVKQVHFLTARPCSLLNWEPFTGFQVATKCRHHTGIPQPKLLGPTEQVGLIF